MNRLHQIFCWFFVFNSSLSVAQNNSRLTFYDYVGIPSVSEPQISPNGKWVVYTKAEVNFDKNRYNTDLYLVSLDTKATIRLTTHEMTDHDPAWSPDSRQIAFVSDRTGTDQIWTISIAGGEALQLTHLEQGAFNPHWSPDGSTIAFFTWDTVYTKEDPIVSTRLENPLNFPKIWLIPAKGGGVKKLISQQIFCYHLDWSPDGTKLAYIFNAKGSSLYSEDHQLAVIDILSRETQILTSEDNFANLPVWSPDGQKIAYYAGRSKEWQAYLDMNDIWVWDLKTGKHRNITENLQIQIGGAIGPSESMFWSKDGSSIYFVGSIGGNSNIYQLSVADGSVKQISYFEGEVSAPSLSDDGQTIAFLKSNFQQWDEIYVADMARGEPIALTDVSKDLSLAPLAEIENFHFKSADGVDIEGLLFKPVGYHLGEKYPLIVDIHGGPSYRWGRSLNRYTPWHLYAQRGYGTLLVNPRGSTGYGEEFLHGNYQDFGGKDYQDLIAGVDYVIENYDADPENLFVTGYSYGGYLTNWVITQTDRFRAAVSIAGGINFISSFGQNNPVLLETYYGLPWENFQEYLADSPVSYLENIKTPILLMHGQMDEAVDPSQSREFFTYLQYLGVPSELVIYPREPHTISEPLHVVDFLTRTINWFEKYRRK